jgi:hypothetical protein
MSSCWSGRVSLSGPGVSSLDHALGIRVPTDNASCSTVTQVSGRLPHLRCALRSDDDDHPLIPRLAERVAVLAEVLRGHRVDERPVRGVVQVREVVARRAPMPIVGLITSRQVRDIGIWSLRDDACLRRDRGARTIPVESRENGRTCRRLARGTRQRQPSGGHQ